MIWRATIWCCFAIKGFVWTKWQSSTYHPIKILSYPFTQIHTNLARVHIANQRRKTEPSSFDTYWQWQKRNNTMLPMFTIQMTSVSIQTHILLSKCKKLFGILSLHCHNFCIIIQKELHWQQQTKISKVTMTPKVGEVATIFRLYLFGILCAIYTQSTQ